MHPCGVVLSRQPLHELTPTFLSNKGWPATHLDMDAVEAVGLVKMDILAQGGLAVMREARRNAECRMKNAEFHFGEAAESASAFCIHPSSFNDSEVWEMIAGGGARAVHHIESPAMVSLCRMCNVREIDGLIAIVSVIRPGAANEQKKARFTRRYQRMEPPEYPHPSLEPCLRSTFGLVVYEEHILQICEAFAGLNPGRADVLRRALVKQNRSAVEGIAGEFAASARARGHSPEKIREVWELVTGFNGYAFCKAHSTAYGVEAYQAAWLKRYYPAQFMAAVLTHGKGFYHPLVYVLECHRLGISFLSPSINHPGPEFKAEGRMKNAETNSAASPEAVSAFSLQPSAFIRAPLTRVKGLTTRTAEAILEARRRGPFISMADFFHRVAPPGEELEAMIRVGAFDEFGRTRTQQFWELQYLGKAECRTKNAEFHFSEAAESPSAFCIPPSAFLQEPSRRQRLQWESDYFDFTVSGHPLELHEDVAWDTYCPVARLAEHTGREVVTCGLVVEQRTHHQVTGEPMKFLTLADWTGMVETELFAAAYRSYGLATVRYPVLEIAARVEPFENGRGFSLRVLRAGKPRMRR